MNKFKISLECSYMQYTGVNSLKEICEWLKKDVIYSAINNEKAHFFYYNKDKKDKSIDVNLFDYIIKDSMGKISVYTGTEDRFIKNFGNIINEEKNE